MRTVLLLLLGLVITVQSNAQKAVGTWTDYLSFSNGIKVVDAGDRVFCATEGGLFYVDNEDNSINKFSDLSDFGISTMAYNSSEDLLIVAYTNSNIDLIREGQVFNLSDIKRKITTSDKTIHNISIQNKEAYISCGFGIVVINLDKNEVKDTYIIGDEGLPLTIFDVDFFENRIYAATQEGILWAPESGVNLLDYANWVRVDNIPHADEPYTQLEVHGGNLIANHSLGETSNDEAYLYDGNNWTLLYSGLNKVVELHSSGTYLSFTAKRKIVIFDNNYSNVGSIDKYEIGEELIQPIYANSTVVSQDGKIWIADYDNALVSLEGTTFEQLEPNGPVDNEVFDLEATESEIYVAPGGRTDAWNNSFMKPRFQRFQDGEWTNFSSTEIPELTDFYDIVCIAVDPFDPSHFYAGSWGGGILEFRNDELVIRYTNNNSPLQTALPQQPNEPYVRIGGLDFDSEGNLWISNVSTAGNNLHKLSPDGDWESFTMNGLADKAIGQLLVNSNDDKWVLIPRGNDAYVVGKNTSQKRKLLVTSYFSNGTDEYTTRMNDVYSIAEDKEGAIWIGTSKGVAVYNNPSQIWETELFYASQPGLDLNDGIYHPLLSTETVTAIAVDGANRKWLGTSSSGVFLVSENGEQEVLHLTAENSPLLSNNIKAIAINEQSGEVYFGTDNGLISYQGDASGGRDDYSNVYVYPNPVRETYSGPVTVTGLVADTDVKITDISGNLVYETTSLGGQAVWDGKNLNGNRVKTGVYLVFCNDKLGEETHITKILFIH